MSNRLVTVKNVFCGVTLAWSAIMLVEYLLALVGVPSFLAPVFNFLLLFLYLGIWGVPVLFLLSTVLVFCVKCKHKPDAPYRWLNFFAVGLPILTAVLMLCTNCNEILQ